MFCVVLLVVIMSTLLYAEKTNRSSVDSVPCTVFLRDSRWTQSHEQQSYEISKKIGNDNWLSELNKRALSDWSQCVYFDQWVRAHNDVNPSNWLVSEQTVMSLIKPGNSSMGSDHYEYACKLDNMCVNAGLISPGLCAEKGDEVLSSFVPIITLGNTCSSSSSSSSSTGGCFSAGPTDGTSTSRYKGSRQSDGESSDGHGSAAQTRRVINTSAAAAEQSTSDRTWRYLRGVNLAGAEFGEAYLPGLFGQNYTYPTAEELGYYNSKMLDLIRLPFRWERLQRSLLGELDVEELARLDGFVGAAKERGMRVILDPHNYGRYHGEVIGSTAVPYAAFADFWRRVAQHYRDETAVWAYGLMNEPHDTDGRWPAAAQAAVDAIRELDSTHVILVPGDGWGGAYQWQERNANLNVKDPANNLIYEAHQYFDRDGSGKYATSYDVDGAYAEIGVDRLKPFVDWLKRRKARGFIGEFGVPDTDPRWLTVLENFLTAMDRAELGGTYWAGGPWWGEGYAQSVEPRQGQDRPQMAVLVRHLSL